VQWVCFRRPSAAVYWAVKSSASGSQQYLHGVCAGNHQAAAAKRLPAAGVWADEVPHRKK
jgi:hypothetical protein